MMRSGSHKLRGKFQYKHVLCIVLFLYSLAPLAAAKAGQGVLAAAVILQCVLFGITAYQERRWIEKPANFFEVILYGIGIFALGGILLYCFGLDIGYGEGYETELYLLLFALIYLTVKSRPYMEKCYFDSILAALILIDLICLVYYLVWPEMGGCIGRFVQSKESVSSCTMPAVLIGSMKYSYCMDKRKQWMYALSTVIACIVLAVNRDVLSLYMMSAVLLLVLIYNVPKKEIIKRNLQVFCGYVFLLCNMSLVTNYTSFLQVECSGYTLETSVISELLLCSFLCYVMSVWDKLPEEEETTEKECTAMLQKLQGDFKKILTAGGFFLIGIVLTGDRLENLPDGTVWQSIEAAGIELYQAICKVSESNAFYRGAQSYGALGVLLVLAVWSGMTARIRRKRKPVIRDNIILTVAAIMVVPAWTVRLRNDTSYLLFMWLITFACIPNLIFKKKKSLREL